MNRVNTPSRATMTSTARSVNDGVGAVSYTHLDVYKRQVIEDGARFKGRIEMDVELPPGV